MPQLRINLQCPTHPLIRVAVGDHGTECVERHGAVNWGAIIVPGRLSIIHIAIRRARSRKPRVCIYFTMVRQVAERSVLQYSDQCNVSQLTRGQDVWLELFDCQI